jgi:hypothetical protein
VADCSWYATGLSLNATAPPTQENLGILLFSANTLEIRPFADGGGTFSAQEDDGYSVMAVCP